MFSNLKNIREIFSGMPYVSLSRRSHSPKSMLEKALSLEIS